MPTIPTYDGPRVADAPLRATYQTVPTGTGRAAIGVSQALGAVADATDHLAQVQDTRDAFNAETAIKSKWLEADAQLRQKYRGANTDGYLNDVKTFWDQAQTDATSQLSARGQNIVRQSLGVARLQAQSSAQNYFTQETNRSADEAFQASKAVELNRALADARPETIATSIELLKRMNAGQGALRGLTTEQVQAANLQDTSVLHSEFISQLSQTDPTAAKAYFDAHRDEIRGDRIDTINKVLVAETLNLKAKRTADSLASKPLDEQLVEVSKITDPVLRDKTQTAVKNNYGLVKEAQQEREKSFSDKAWQMVGAGKRVPETVLTGMDGRERVRLQDYLRERAEHAANQGEKAVKTDPATHALLWDLMVNDPDDFKRERLAAYAYKLSGQDLEQLMTKQETLRNPKAERDVQSFQQRVSARLEQLGISTGKSSEQERGGFRSQAQAAVDAHTKRTGKQPTAADETAILDSLTLDGSVINPWMNEGRKAYQIKPEDRPRFVPDAAKKQIVEALKAEGVSASDENILKRWQRAQGIR